MALVLVVGMTLGLSACGNSSKSSDAASKNDDSVLVVGFDQNFPPFGYKNKKGKFVGFDIEAAVRILPRNGRHFSVACFFCPFWGKQKR